MHLRGELAALGHLVPDVQAMIPFGSVPVASSHGPAFRGKDLADVLTPAYQRLAADQPEHAEPRGNESR